MNSLDVKHQGKNSKQLAFHSSDYTHLWNFKEEYFRRIKSTRYKLTVWIIQESDPYDKNGMQQKVNVLVRLHKAMQEKSKTASYLEPIQILTLVPDKWSRLYCLEYFNILEYLVWTSHEIKKVDEILAKPAPEKRKSYHHRNTSSSNKRFWRWKCQ